ncbi:MAG: hypothetical protein HZC28_08575 [Spirochaetes bacterium]|nr:hypothetical protein [Spirochaetota bacterium]
MDVPRKKKTYDWVRIREEYITGEDKITQEYQSQKYEVAKSVLARRCVNEGWVSKREQYRIELSNRIRSEMIKRHSGDILKTADFLQVVRNYYKKHLFRRDPNGKISDIPEDSIPIELLNGLMSGIEKNVKLTRLIIGEPTEVISSPESWEEKVKRLRSERGANSDDEIDNDLNVADKRKQLNNSDENT